MFPLRLCGGKLLVAVTRERRYGPSRLRVNDDDDDSQLDYGNGLLVGLPAYLTRRLQSVLNAAARLIYRLTTRDHLSDALISLHWLRVPERIQYKLAVLAYKVLHGDASRYLGPLTRVDDLPGRRTLRSTNAKRLVVAYPPSNCQQSAAELLRLRLHTSGIHCQLTSLRQIHCQLPSTVKTFLVQAIIS